MRLRRLLPGSLDTLGWLVDVNGDRHATGPCWIPANISIARTEALKRAGWGVCPKHLRPERPGPLMMCLLWSPPF